MAKMADTMRISWSIFWKWAVLSAPLAVASGAAVGFVLGGVSVAFGGLTPGWLLAIQISAGVVGVLIAFLVLNFFVSRSIGKNIGAKRLVLIESASGQEI